MLVIGSSRDVSAYQSGGTQKGDIVEFQGAYYIAKVSTDNAPPHSDWYSLAAGSGGSGSGVPDDVLSRISDLEQVTNAIQKRTQYDFPFLLVEDNSDQWWVVNLQNGQSAKSTSSQHDSVTATQAWARREDTANPLTYT
jgi:hypothetical protein